MPDDQVYKRDGRAVALDVAAVPLRPAQRVPVTGKVWFTQGSPGHEHWAPVNVIVKVAFQVLTPVKAPISR